MLNLINIFDENVLKLVNMNVKIKSLTVGALFFLGGATVMAQKKDSATTKQIDEVVVTALGIKKAEKSLGYASTKVGSDELVKVNNQNVLNSLSGKVAGVQVVASNGAPGSASRLIIRGGQSL